MAYLGDKKISLSGVYTVVANGGVPTTRTINGKPLSDDIVLTADDVGACTESDLAVVNKSIEETNKSVEETNKSVETLKQVLLQNEQAVVLPISESYSARQTANGADIFDEQYTPVSMVEGNTVACHNLVNLEAMKNLAVLNNVEIDSNKNTIKLLNDAGGGLYISCIGDENCTAYEKFVKCFGISKAGKYRCTFKSLVNNATTYWRFNIGATTLFKIGDGNGTVFEVTQENIDAIKSIATGNVKLLVYGLTDDVFGEFQIVEGEEEKPYMPYFAGLKNASFKGITSTGEDKEDTLQLAETLEMGAYDTFNPQTGEYVKQTKLLTLNGTESWTYYGASSIEGANIFIYSPSSDLYSAQSEIINSGIGELATLNFTGLQNGAYQTIVTSAYFSTADELKAYLANNPIQIAYKLATPQRKTVNSSASYKAWKNGTETILQGDTENGGVMPKITQTYLAKIGGDE